MTIIEAHEKILEIQKRLDELIETEGYIRQDLQGAWMKVEDARIIAEEIGGAA